MENLRKTIYVILCVIAVLIMVVSLLSVFRNTESRFLKMLDFPRIQVFITSAVSLILFVILTKRWRWYDYALVVGLLGGLVTNGRYLINYTPLVAEAVPGVAENYRTENELSLMLINVKMSNRTVEPLLELIERRQPDLIVAMEVDEWWEANLEVIEQHYPHREETINSVSYGMTLYSKLPVKDVNVNYLQNEKVPSYDAIVTLPGGQDVHLHAVHPVPPKHFEDLPDNEGQEEKALVKLGRKIEDHTLPVIVAGDFNDVVWGFTNELTETDDLLHDVRVGRGFYNSFDAQNFFMRWPLDHFFVTEEFKVKNLERLPDVGSDHFPILVELAL